jgi:hypothetical protein
MSLMPLKIKRLKKKLLPLNPLNPRITFKKAKSSAELVKLNQNYNPIYFNVMAHEYDSCIRKLRFQPDWMWKGRCFSSMLLR